MHAHRSRDLTTADLEMMAQMILYLLLSVDTVDWSLLLVIIAGYYLDAKNQRRRPRRRPHPFICPP